MKKRLLLVTLLLMIFGCILGCRFGIQSKTIPLSQCVVQTDCVIGVRSDLEHLYTWDKNVLSSLFSDYRTLWIWKTFHPGVCTAFTGPIPEKLESKDWDYPLPNGVGVGTWSLLAPTTIYWNGGTGADTRVRNDLLPQDFPLMGCDFWASADAASPDVHYQDVFGVVMYSHSITLRNLHWVCELWHADPDKVSEDIAEAQRLQRKEIEQLLERSAFQPNPEDLARLCDWYLWCNADMTTCRTGGRSMHFQLPGQEPPSE